MLEFGSAGKQTAGAGLIEAHNSGTVEVFPTQVSPNSFLNPVVVTGDFFGGTETAFVVSFRVSPFRVTPFRVTLNPARFDSQ